MTDFLIISIALSVLSFIIACVAVYLVLLKVNTSKLSKVELDNFCLSIDKRINEGLEAVGKNGKRIEEIQQAIVSAEKGVEKAQEHYRSIKATVANLSRQIKNSSDNDSIDNADTESVDMSQIFAQQQQQQQQSNFYPSAAMLARMARRSR